MAFEIVGDIQAFCFIRFLRASLLRDFSVCGVPLFELRLELVGYIG